MRAAERRRVDFDGAVHERPKARRVVQRGDDLPRLEKRLGDSLRVEPPREVLEQLIDGHGFGEPIDAHASAPELIFDVGQLERVDERPDVAVHESLEVVRRPADAVIGDAALRIVVRADLSRAVAGADLRLPHARARGLLLGHA